VAGWHAPDATTASTATTALNTFMLTVNLAKRSDTGRGRALSGKERQDLPVHTQLCRKNAAGAVHSNHSLQHTAREYAPE